MKILIRGRSMIEPDEVVATIQLTLFVDGDKIVYIRAFGANWTLKAGAVPTMTLTVPLLKKKRKTYCRIPKDNVWRKSKKYGTTITIEEKEKVLNYIIRNPKVSTKKIIFDTGVPYHKVLATLDLLKVERTVVKVLDNEQKPVYMYQP
jgi:hypothetical protein